MRIVRTGQAAQKIKYRDSRTVQAHLLEELVVRALEEGRRGGHHRRATRPCDAGSVRHGMRFGDARVYIMCARALSELMGDAVRARRGGEMTTSPGSAAKRGSSAAIAILP